MRATNGLLAAARRARLLCAVLGVGTALVLGQPSGAAAPPAFRPVTVGADGSEPLVRVSPDGRTVYVAALQHVYVSRDAGLTFQPVHDLVVGGPAGYASDSSLDVDGDGDLHVAVNYPYAGTVAACVSGDRARSFRCNPGVVPGVNDRQWLVSDGPDRTYLTSNVGLYETVLFASPDGFTYTPAKAVEAELSPSTGGLVVLPGGSLLQPFIDDGDAGHGSQGAGPELDGLLSVLEWDPDGPARTAVKRTTPLLAGTGLPSLAATSDGAAFLVSEGVTGARAGAGGGPDVITGKNVVLARTRDRGRSWQLLPPLPGTTSGTAAMSAVTAGAPGHVGVLSYRNRQGSSAASATGDWDVVWAETRDALSPRPTWRTTVVERRVHRGPICSHATCFGADRFAGDFISAHIDRTGRAHLVYVRDHRGATQVRYATPTHGATAR